MSFVLFCVLGTVFYVGNNYLSVGVTDETQGVRAGSVVYMHDLVTGADIMSGQAQFSGVNSGTFIPANGGITLLNDSTLVFHTDHFTDGVDVLPLDYTVTYTVVGRGLEMRYRFEYLADDEFLDPLEIDFNVAGWDSLEISNQTTVDEVFALNGTTGFQRFSGDQLFRYTGGSNPPALFVFPNNPKGIAVVNDDGNPYMSLRVLGVEAPRENAQGPDLHSVIAAGEVDQYFVRFSMDQYFAPVFISGHPYGAQHSAAWILDELTFLHPDQGFIWGFSEDSSGTEPVSAALITLLDEHPTMKMNWLLLPDAILTPNRDSVWYEPGYYDSWSHWHGTWRFSTEATPGYLQWLRNIQDNVYPWADRVQMGNHGYHHTPNPDSSYGEYHEFITYEPLEHQERFRMIYQDIAACGLDTSMVRIIRYSGHRTSLSGLQAAIDRGFTFFCNGWRLIDWYAGKRFTNQWISRFQTPNGRMWGSNTVWWGDYQMDCPYEWLANVMDSGKFCLLGGHPLQMFEVWQSSWLPEAYDRIDSVITALESYDDFVWLFPAEYGDFLEACFNISVSSMRDTGGVLRLTMDGSIPDGLTFVAMLKPEDDVYSVTLDGTAISWEMRDGGRLFAISPEMANGQHELQINFNPLTVENESAVCGSFSVSLQNPCFSGFLVLDIQGLSTGESFEVVVHDIAGRLIYKKHEMFSGSEVIVQPSRPLPPGLYFATVSSGGNSATARVVVSGR